MEGVYYICAFISLPALNFIKIIDILYYVPGNRIAQRQCFIPDNSKRRQFRRCGSSFKFTESELFLDSEQYRIDRFWFAFD